MFVISEYEKKLMPLKDGKGYRVNQYYGKISLDK